MEQTAHTWVTQPRSPGLVDASDNRRLANYLIDTVGVAFAGIPLGATIGMLLGFAGVDPADVARIPGTVFGVSVALFYFTFFEGVLGWTPGKLLTGTRVVTLDGRPPGLLKALARTLVRLVPFDPLSFLSSRGGWHDRWTGTRVVLVRP